MANKKKPVRSNSSVSSNSHLKFRASTSSDMKDTKGTKPCQDRSSINSVFVVLIQHLCRKIVFFNTNYKVVAYLGSLFLISLLADVLPFPKTSLARKDNIFNLYFVKISWGWTLLLSIPFVLLTSLTYCCGKKNQVLKHLLRLVVASSMWYFWTNMFIYLEHLFGYCSLKDPKYQTKSACLAKGHFWQSIDISGHSFILIYSSLVLIEECRVIICWDSISDLIREEEHIRNNEEDENSYKNTLKKLSPQEFSILKEYYINFTPYIRLLFCLITIIILIWDLMLLTTILYFHNMLEKLLAGFIAIGTWYLTYKVGFPKILLRPGEGSFKYRDDKISKDKPKLRSAMKVPGPKFMGMPLKIQDESSKSEEKNNKV